jgi:hypothetical protein
MKRQHTRFLPTLRLTRITSALTPRSVCAANQQPFELVHTATIYPLGVWKKKKKKEKKKKKKKSFARRRHPATSHSACEARKTSLV